MASTTVHKTSSIRNVDAYRVGNTIKQDGEWQTITGYKRTLNDQGQYDHALTLRPATADEAKAGHIEELKWQLRAMGPGPDDEQDRARHAARERQLQNEIRKLEGKPSVEEEQRSKQDARRAAFIKDWTDGTMQDRIAYATRLANRPGLPLHNNASQYNVNKAIGVTDDRFDQLRGSEDGPAPTDDELQRLARVMGVTVEQLRHGKGEVPTL